MTIFAITTTIYIDDGLSHKRSLVFDQFVIAIHVGVGLLNGLKKRYLNPLIYQKFIIIAQNIIKR